MGHSTGRKLLTKLLARVHGPAVDDHLWSVPVRLHPFNNVCERKALMRPDVMDPTEHRLLEDTMSRRPRVFVDVGANVGFYSLHAAIVSPPGATILAIEPNPTLLARFRFNLEMAKRCGRISPDVSLNIANVAVGDREGQEVLVASGGEGTGSLALKGNGRNRGPSAAPYDTTGKARYSAHRSHEDRHRRLRGSRHRGHSIQRSREFGGRARRF